MIRNWAGAGKVGNSAPTKPGIKGRDSAPTKPTISGSQTSRFAKETREDCLSLGQLSEQPYTCLLLSDRARSQREEDRGGSLAGMHKSFKDKAESKQEASKCPLFALEGSSRSVVCTGRVAVSCMHDGGSVSCT